MTKPADNLTDDDVVQIIAEYMGEKPSGYYCKKCGPCQKTEYIEYNGEFCLACRGDAEWHWCPPYLTSHDALAPVYRKLYADPDRFQRFNAACDAVERAIGLKGPLSCVGCYWVEPRDHAYAIARALRAAKMPGAASENL